MKPQICPNCGSKNITRAERGKGDKFKHRKPKAYGCHDCHYKWYMVVVGREDADLSD